MTLPTIPCQAFTADGLSKGTTTDIASELVKIGALHKPTKLEKQAAKFTSRINRAIVDTLSEHHVRVLKSGAFRKSLSPAKQRARQRQLNALGCLLDKAIVKAAIEVDRDEAREQLAKATSKYETAKILRDESERYLAKHQATVATVAQQSQRLADQTLSLRHDLAVVNANLDAANAEVAKRAARHAEWQQRQLAAEASSFSDLARQTDDPDLRSALTALAIGGDHD